MSSVWSAIEKIRQEPEYVRRRYVFLCVAATMGFVILVWFLTLGESVRSVSETLPEESGFSSLSELVRRGEPVDVRREQEGAENFFEDQLRLKDESAQEKKISDDNQ